jgi:23S rRNA G2069 N7-methylase RlmK/C1962 C5-methylase RlmI
MNRHELYEEIQKLEKETGFTLAITDPKKFKENKKRLDKLQKQFQKAVTR